MKSLRIIIFAGYYLPYRGGYVESLHGLSKGLVQAGHEVTIVTTNVSKSKSEETIEGVKVIRLSGWHLLNKTYPVISPSPKTFRMLWDLWRAPYDVASTQTRFFVTSFLGAFFALTRRIPMFHTERGAYHSVVENRFLNFISRFIDHTLGFFVVRIAKRNVGVSKAACQFLEHLKARNISVVPNGVELIPAISDKQYDKMKEKWAFPKENRLLLFVGRLIYAKGCQDVIAILPELLKIESNLQFVIAGDGPYRSELERLTKEKNLHKHVRFLGLLDADEVIEVLQIADWFVNPSHSEGLPRSVLEASAAGLPIVASDVGGTREIIEDGESGLLFEKEDQNALQKHLEKLLSNPEYAKKLGNQIRQNTDHTFAWPKIIQSYSDLMKEII